MVRKEGREYRGIKPLVGYLENLRQNDQEILNKSGWAPRSEPPTTHTFGNLFGSGYAGLGFIEVFVTVNQPITFAPSCPCIIQETG